MHEFRHVTEMMKDDQLTFKEFVREMVDKSKDFLSFVQKFDQSAKAVHIAFYELDSDSYEYEVSKWSVEFSPSKKASIEFSGYYIDTIYVVTNKETQQFEFRGDFYEINDYINSEKFKDLTQQDVQRLYSLKTYKFDKCLEWIGYIEGFDITFKGEETDLD